MTERKEVTFTLHAEDKLRRLMRVGVTKERVLEVIEDPEKVISGYYGRKQDSASLFKGGFDIENRL
jgi:hypothetical protein